MIPRARTQAKDLAITADVSTNSKISFYLVVESRPLSPDIRRDRIFDDHAHLRNQDGGLVYVCHVDRDVGQGARPVEVVRPDLQRVLLLGLVI